MKARDLSEVLKNFDNLPDAALVPRKAAALILGESETKLRRDNPGIPITTITKGYPAKWVRERLARRPKFQDNLTHWRQIGDVAQRVVESCGADIRDHQRKMQAELRRREKGER